LSIDKIVAKSKQKIVETDIEIDSPSTHIHYHSPSWFDTGT